MKIKFGDHTKFPGMEQKIYITNDLHAVDVYFLQISIQTHLDRSSRARSSTMISRKRKKQPHASAIEFQLAMQASADRGRVHELLRV